MKITELDRHNNFEQISHLVNNLLAELFGKDACITDADLARIKHQWQQQQAAHWAFKVEADDNVIGFFTIAESFALYTRGFYGVINELWVDRQYRSQGVGKQIIDFIRDFSRQKNWLRVDVTAPPGDKWLRSVEFYQHNGFNHTGVKLKLFIE